MAEAVHDAQRLKELQALPLDRKIQISQARIIEWYQRNHGNVVVSFSGGKDSTVLLHLVRTIFPDVPAVFSNTGLEYPEIQRFVRTFPNVEIVAPKMNFSEVISTYGYPLIGKEVAEAIYYARRIRSQSVHVEREREREQEQHDALEASGTSRLAQNAGGGLALQTGTPRTADTLSTQAERRTDGQSSAASGGGTGNPTPTERPHRELADSGTSRERNLGGGQRKSPWTGDYSKLGTWKRWDINGRRQAGVNGATITDEASTQATETRTTRNASSTARQNGQTGEGGVFSPDSQAQFGEKSIFNKEKYLPLARDVPIPISHLCCSKMKKSPMQIYQRAHKVVPFLGTLAEESRIRQQAWIRHGCNAFDSKKPQSTPIAFWTEQDILQYIVEYGLDLAAVYGEIVGVDKDGNEYPASCSMCAGCTLKCTGADRTGCVYCGFGFHNEKGETRFQRIARTHPRQYEYCMGGGQWVDNPAYDPAAPEYDGEWKNWNPKKIWVPSKKGLGLKTVFDMVNEIYGKDFYRYE